MERLCGRYELESVVYSSTTTVVLRAVDHGLCRQVYGKYNKMNDDSFNKAMDELYEAGTHSDSLREIGQSWYDDFKQLAEDGVVSWERFEEFSAKTFGKFQVVMKCMRDRSAYDMEVSSRRDLVHNKHIVHLLSSPSQDELRAAFSTLQFSDVQFNLYPWVVVMPAASLTIAEVINSEDLQFKCDVLKAVAVAIKSLHDNYIYHGDLTKFDIVYVQNKLQLVDLDAAANEDRPHGVKFSHGILPPEMFKRYDPDGEDDDDEPTLIQQHWDDYDDHHKSRIFHDNIIVRAYCPQRGHEDLPDGFVLEASHRADAWAYGCLMFEMLSGEEFVQTIGGPKMALERHHIQRAASWTQDEINERIEEKIENKYARELLKLTLSEDPDLRPTMEFIIKHKYFSGVKSRKSLMEHFDDIREKSKSIEQNLTEIHQQVVANNRVMLASIDEMAAAIEAMKLTLLTATLEAQIDVPTSFIVLPTKLKAPTGDDDDDDDNEQTANSFLSFLWTTGRRFAQSLGDSNATAVALREMAGGRPMWLYLIDEVTRRPVIPDADDDTYPIKLVADSEELLQFMTSCMPMIQSGLKLVTTVNSIASLFSWIGVPSVDRDKLEDAKKAIDAMNCTPQVLLSSLNSADTSPEAVHRVRGAQLRQLSQVFKANDEEQTFCGLERWHYDGEAIWSTPESIAMLRANIPLEQVRAEATAAFSIEYPQAADEQIQAIATESFEYAQGLEQQGQAFVPQTFSTYPPSQDAQVQALPPQSVGYIPPQEENYPTIPAGVPAPQQAPKVATTPQQDCDAFLERVGMDIQKSCASPRPATSSRTGQEDGPLPQGEELRQTVAQLEKLHTQLIKISQAKLQGKLPWREVATALQEERQLSETQNKALRAQVKEHRKHVHDMYKWVLGTLVIQTGPNATTPTWRNVSLHANPASRKVGKQWITKFMYHNADRMFHEYGFPSIASGEILPCELDFPYKEDAGFTTVYRHQVDGNIPFEYMTTGFSVEWIIQSFMPQPVATILNEADEESMQCAVLSHDGEYVNLLSVHDDETCKATDDNYQRNRLFWIDIHRLPGGRTRNRTLFFTSAIFTKDGYVSLDEDARDWGFTVSQYPPEQQEAMFVSSMRRAVSAQHRKSQCPHCTLA
ncbi:hypothetical protein AeRB84_021710 [Aphanomyces euteiches]|nr:hypothetical protein AeRB84_021710 [Aphanomyces euteiches]